MTTIAGDRAVQVFCSDGRRRHYRQRLGGNPAGRCVVEFDYRIPKGVGPERLAAAERVCKHYFLRVGGVRKFDTRGVRQMIDLLDRHPESHLIMAIDAKAETLRPADDSPAARAEKNKFRGTFEGFFGGGKWRCFLEQHPRFVASQPPERDACDPDESTRRRFDAAIQRRVRRIRRASPAQWEFDLAGGGVKQVRPAHARLVERAFHEALDAAIDAGGRWNRLFDQLSPDRRRAALRAARGGFERAMRDYGRDPDDLRVEPLWVVWRAMWALHRWPTLAEAKEDGT